MSIVLETELGRIRIPQGIQDEESFRRWIAAANLPEEVSVRFEGGEIRVELPPNGLPPSISVKRARMKGEF
jgi:hypothetical protein